MHLLISWKFRIEGFELRDIMQHYIAGDFIYLFSKNNKTKTKQKSLHPILPYNKEYFQMKRQFLALLIAIFMIQIFVSASWPHNLKMPDG